MVWMVEIPTEARHYYRGSRRPFANLSDLDPVDAEAVIQDLEAEGRQGEHRRVFGRRYMELRRRTEARMRALFVAAGGRPERVAPHYLVLGGSDWFEALPVDMRVLVIPLADLPDHATSFTYPDSFTAMGLAPEFGLPYEPKPYHERVFRLDDLDQVLTQYGMPSDDGVTHSGYADHPFELYVEVQLWTDEPIAQLIGRQSERPYNAGLWG